MTIGKRISELRKKHGFTQEYVADKLQVSRQAVSKWEQDLTCPDSWNLIELAKLFDTTVEYLTLGCEKAEPVPQTPPIPTKSFCGRDCSTCEFKARLACSGCRYSEHHLPVLRCSIAECCSRFGLRSCNQCSRNDNCRHLMNRDTFSQKRCEKQEALQNLRESQTNIRSDCYRWISILPFAVIANLLLDLFLVDLLPPLSVIVGLVYSFCLFKLAKQADQYKVAAVCIAVLSVLRCAAAYVVDTQPVLVFFYNLIYPIIFPLSVYMELHGHECIASVFTDSTAIYHRLRTVYAVIAVVQGVCIVGMMFNNSALLAVIYLIGLVARVLAEVIHIIALFILKGSLRS